MQPNRRQEPPAVGAVAIWLGAFPHTLAGIWILHDLKHCDTAELKVRLDRQYAISHFVIA